MSGRARVVARDRPDEHPRTTAALLASLSARLGSLGLVSGGDAIGSQLAGIAALGRAVARTEDGRRLLEGLRRNRAGENGPALWEALRLAQWLSSVPPSPVLDELRNDLALLLAADLRDVLGRPAAGASVPAAALSRPEPVGFEDLALGLWAWGREVSRSVEAAAGGAPSAVPTTVAPPATDDGGPVGGPLLR